jgi:hypothetical protein
VFCIEIFSNKLDLFESTCFILPGFHTLAAVGNSAETGSPGLKVLKLFPLSLMLQQIKLERLPQPSF